MNSKQVYVKEEDDESFSESRYTQSKGLSMSSRNNGSVFLVDNADFFYKKEHRFASPSFFNVGNIKADQLTLMDDLYIKENTSEENKYTLKCTIQELVFFPKDDFFYQTFIQQQDLIGADVYENRSGKNAMHQLRIVLLLKKVGGCVSQTQRVRKEHIFYHPDLDKLVIWKNLIQHITKDTDYLYKNQRQISSKQFIPFEFKLLIFINPFSGPGNARSIWQKCKNLLKTAGYILTEIETERVNHARDIILEMESNELFSYQGICSVSGDGLPHEILNALATREDSQKALQIGLSPLPGGSANALAKNIASKSMEPNDVQGACFQIIKGQKIKIDVLQLEFDSSNNVDETQIDSNTNNQQQQIQSRKQKVYSFLSICCAFIADVDLNSEGLRCMGEARFDVWGFYRTICQKHINIVLEVRCQDNNISQQTSVDNNIQSLMSSQQYKQQKKSQDRENLQTQQQQKKIIKNSEESVKTDFTSRDQLSNNMMGNMEQGWETFQGKCKYLMFQNMPYISSSTYSAPLADFQDGFQDMQLIINKSWCALLCQSLDFQEGGQFTLKKKNKQENCKPVRKSLTHRMCKEFKIYEQNQQNILFSVDGERYEAPSVHGKVMARSFSIFCNIE